MGQNQESRSESRRLSLRRSLLVWVACAVFGWVIGLVSLYYVIRTNETITAQDQTTSAATESVAETGAPATEDQPPSESEIEALRDVRPAAGPGAEMGSVSESPADKAVGEGQAAPPPETEINRLDDDPPGPGANPTTFSRNLASADLSRFWKRSRP